MELLTSFMPQELESADGGASAGATLRQHLRVVWPSVEAVRKSTKGWISGVCVISIPARVFVDLCAMSALTVPQKNIFDVYPVIVSHVPRP